MRGFWALVGLTLIGCATPSPSPESPRVAEYSSGSPATPKRFPPTPPPAEPAFSAETAKDVVRSHLREQYQFEPESYELGKPLLLRDGGWRVAVDHPKFWEWSGADCFVSPDRSARMVGRRR